MEQPLSTNEYIQRLNAYIQRFIGGQIAVKDIEGYTTIVEINSVGIEFNQDLTVRLKWKVKGRGPPLKDNYHAVNEAPLDLNFVTNMELYYSGKMKKQELELKSPIIHETIAFFTRDARTLYPLSIEDLVSN